jgi:hypothetical protein
MPAGLFFGRIARRWRHRVRCSFSAASLRLQRIPAIPAALIQRKPDVKKAPIVN